MDEACHPRVRNVINGAASPKGPSPRARGSLRRRNDALDCRPRCAGSPGVFPDNFLRSIPACAGKPPEAWSFGPGPRVRASPMTENVGRPRVHPRVRGEASAWNHHIDGPSPCAAPRFARGSIPACAGKPDRGEYHEGSIVIAGLIARIPACAKPFSTPSGPSPRARGMRPVESLGPVVRGEASETSRNSGTWVHPRVRGEASVILTRPWAARGSQLFVRADDDGSIPACAGKPLSLI